MIETTQTREDPYPVSQGFGEFVESYRNLIKGIPITHRTDSRSSVFVPLFWAEKTLS